MTERPVPMKTLPAELRRIAVLAWPVVLGQLGLMMMGIVDTLMVGRHGAVAVAGLGLGHAWTFAAAIVGIGAAMGLDPMLTQAHGARDNAAYDRAVAHGVGLLGWLCIPIGALHLVCGPVMVALGEPAEVIGLAHDYSVILTLSVPPLLAFSLLRQGLQARELMKPAMWVILGANVANIAINAVLLFGVGDWPGLGPVGVAWATTSVRWLMFLALLPWCLRELRAVARAWREAFNVRALVRVAGVALPVGVQTGLEVWAFGLGTVIVGWFGAVAVAAHQVTLNLTALSFMVPTGIGSAAATRVGNLVGAGQPWQRPGWVAVGLGASVMTMSAVVYATQAAPLAKLFLPDDPAAVAMVALLLPIGAVFQVFDGTQVVAFGVLRGLGDTRVPALANIVGYYALGLPAGAALALYGGLGPAGVWVGLTIALSSVALILLGRLWVLARRGLPGQVAGVEVAS